MTPFQQGDLCSCNSVIITAQRLAWGQPNGSFRGKFHARLRGPQRPLAVSLAAARPQLVKGFPTPPKKLAVAMTLQSVPAAKEDQLVRRVCVLEKLTVTTGPQAQGCIRTTTPRVQSAAAARARQ